MYGFILVSHSDEVARGTKKIIEQMVNETDDLKVIACGGTEDGEIGTSTSRIQEAIESLSEVDHIFIFTDIGSSIMSSEMALEMLDDADVASKITIMEEPFVEGAFEAAVDASVGKSVEDIVKKGK